MPRITIEEQTEGNAPKTGKDGLEERENAFKSCFECFEVMSQDFNAQKTFEQLKGYIEKYDRVLYSTISNNIYDHYNHDDKSLGNIQSNLEALVVWCENSNFEQDKRTAFPRSKADNAMKGVKDKTHLTEDTKKIVLKMWDHVTLASQQYTILKQSDEEYDKKFQERIKKHQDKMNMEFQEKIAKYQAEMNAQMISMVGIFTALAFLVFGSISSLDGIFENIQFPIFKVMSIGLIWGFCVINMIFVFLYCVGKMTKLSFKSTTDDTENNIFKNYPIVVYTNYVIAVLLLPSLFGWFLQQTGIAMTLVKQIQGYPTVIFGGGIVLILVVIWILGCCLRNKMKRESHEST
jgi:hypothetical protein